MRVIAGSARGIRLHGPAGYPGTRPLAARAKEALFSILGDRVPGSRFLDLYAGTGAVGIEALSRGAREAVFVEREAAPVEDIRKNLERTRLAGAARVVRDDVMRFLDRPPTPFDLVFVAPPQWQGLWTRTLVHLDGRPGWLAPRATVIAQCHPKEDREPPLGHLSRARERRYGSILLIFYEPRG